MPTGHAPQLDLLPPRDVIDLLLDAEQRVVPVVRAAGASLAAAAELIAERLRAGGRLAFAGAGTSGRIAHAEAAELPGTFGLPARCVLVRVAGGLSGTDQDEDDTRQAQQHDAELALTSLDVLVAVAASGSTPYTMGIAEAAARRGASVIAVVARRGSPLARLARIAIEVPVGPEVLRDSTRLTAGTAQKVALNVMSTAAMSRLGRVHGDVMVDLVPANAKLRERAVGIVVEIAGCAAPQARAVLVACDWDTRAAILHLAAGLAPDLARRRAAAHSTLRAALNESIGLDH